MYVVNRLCALRQPGSLPERHDRATPELLRNAQLKEPLVRAYVVGATGVWTCGLFRVGN
jgi:hypothetical protein